MDSKGDPLGLTSLPKRLLAGVLRLSPLPPPREPEYAAFLGSVRSMHNAAAPRLIPAERWSGPRPATARSMVARGFSSDLCKIFLDHKLQQKREILKWKKKNTKHCTRTTPDPLARTIKITPASLSLTLPKWTPHRCSRRMESSGAQSISCSRRSAWGLHNACTRS